MTFARWVFNVAGIYGIVVLFPQYFMEDRIGRDDPPALTHVEFFYGFVGVALAWQVAFLAIAHDPLRYRLFMIPAVLEKASFGVAAIVLFAQQRISAAVLVFASLDLVLGVLFVIAFLKTAPDVSQGTPAA